MTSIRPTRLGFLAAALLSILAVAPAAAGPNENPDLASMYLHLDVAIGGAPGPLTTLFYVSNATNLTLTINVKCYNELIDRVGPLAGTTFELAPFDIDVRTITGVAPTSDPDFTGFGWCYFTSNSASGDFAVATSIGVVGGPGSGGLSGLFASSSSLMIGTASAQANVTDDDANVPMWLGSNWLTVLFVINPTATSYGNVVVDIYNVGGVLQNSLQLALTARDMEIFVLAGASSHGNADIGRASGVDTRGLMGWVYAINKTSFEALFYDLPLDNDDVSPLVAGDRP